MTTTGGGGTFCRVRVGRPGTSAAHLRYISREGAVRDGAGGVVLHQLPSEVSATCADGYLSLRASLMAYAWVREASEASPPRLKESLRQNRSHYRATLSFERDIPSDHARTLVVQWLRDAFSGARAAAFLHRDTGHLHAHVWIDARGVNGKKLDLSARHWRTLDEKWNELYARALGIAEQEHLLKKWRTEGMKRLWRETGQGVPSPALLVKRPAVAGERSAYRAKDWVRAGSQEGYEFEQDRTGRSQRPFAPGHPPRTSGERPFETGAAAARRLARSDARAVQDAERLYQALAGVGRERAITHEPTLEPER